MDTLEPWFPYDAYRPHQQQMLKFAAECAENGATAMIDAPTGSGKSSVVAALLSRAHGRKVVVAVRTVSQLNTFIRELELIRKKKGHLKYAYLVGKRNMCPMATSGDPYRLCEGLKGLSASLMRDRAQKGSLIPSQDPLIRQQIKRMDRERPFICPYFIRSRTFVETTEGLKMVPSSRLRSRAEQACTHLIAPERLSVLSDDICPYEVMIQAAREAEVILLNFYHLFDEEIRDQIYQTLNLDPAQTLLLIDEAHNCGDTVQNIQTITIDEKAIEQAGYELGPLRTRVRGAEGIAALLPHITTFMESLKRSWKAEDWFDPVIFLRMTLGNSLYSGVEEVVDDLLRISEVIREKNMNAGEFRETALERLTEFFYRLLRSATEDSYLTLYRRGEEGVVLEVQNIDPAGTIREVAGAHACTVLISGTLSPVESYRRYYFEDAPVETLSLPNAFPRENRRIYCATDVTSAYSKRRDPGNNARIQEYMEVFGEIPGNLAVYFPSYELLHAFAEQVSISGGNKEIFVEPGSAKEATLALNRFLSLPESGRSGILFGVCGGKWSEGLDYRGEMLSGAMVLGLPLAPFTPVRKMTIDYFRKKFGSEGEFISYTLPAINKALQALGRVLRTPDDRGLLVLAEQRFLEPRVRRGLPPWMQDELIACTVESFREDLRSWS
jgi:DNA excision repair protein ERCC-2